MLKKVVSKEEFVAARAALLVEEKKLSREIDRVREMQQKMPMIEVTEAYQFDTPEGPRPLKGLFAGGRAHLLVQHLMFEEANERPCSHCSGWVDGLVGGVPHLRSAGVTFVVVAKASVARLQKVAAAKHWDGVRLASSAGSSFNRDFGVEFTDEEVAAGAPVYDGRAPYASQGHGYSMFWCDPESGRVFLLYQTFRRGLERFFPGLFVCDMRMEGRIDYMPRHREDCPLD